MQHLVLKSNIKILHSKKLFAIINEKKFLQTRKNLFNTRYNSSPFFWHLWNLKLSVVAM